MFFFHNFQNREVYDLSQERMLKRRREANSKT